MYRNINLKEIERFFLSRRLAAALLIFTFLLLVLSTRLRDISIVTDSPFFLILPVLIFTSILICTLNRLRGRGIRQPAPSAFKSNRSSIPGAPLDVEAVEGYLLKKGWKRCGQGEGEMVMTRGQSGFWGSMLFHAGMLLMITAGFASYMAAFSGELLLTQGLPVSLGKEGFLKVWREPFWHTGLPGGKVELERFEAVYKEDRFPVDYTARLKVTDEGGEKFLDAKVNDPLIIGGVQYTIDQYGFSPHFIIKDRAGGVVFDGDVSLVLFGTEDYFEIPGTDAVLHIRFFPDFAMTKEGPASPSKVPRNPVFGLRLERGGVEAGRGRLVKLGNSVEIGGLEIMPAELRYWTHFGVVKDPGQPLFLISFFFMACGLVTRFVYHERWLRLSFNMSETGGYNVGVAGYSRYFPALFEGEVDRIVEGISSLQQARE